MKILEKVKISKENLDYVKFFGGWAVYYTILGLISTNLSYKAAQSAETANLYMASPAAIVISILMVIPNIFFIGALIVSLVKMLIGKIAKKDFSKAKKMAWYSFMFMAVTYLAGSFYFKVFPDHVVNYYNKINTENNKQIVEGEFSAEEISQITEVTKADNSNFPVMKISKIDCTNTKNEYVKLMGVTKEETKDSTESAKEMTDEEELFINTAENCNDGDIQVISGQVITYGQSIDQGFQKYYLMRKTDNKWQIVKMLLEKSWGFTKK